MKSEHNGSSVGQEDHYPFHVVQPSCGVGTTDQRRIASAIPISSSVLNNSRRKSSIKLQQQLSNMDDSGSNSIGTSPGCFSPHPNEIYLHQTKLSIPQQHDNKVTCGSDEQGICVLPPPSPAPNCDQRYTSTILAPSTQVISNYTFQLQPTKPIITSSNSTSSLSTSNSGSNLSSMNTIPTTPEMAALSVTNVNMIVTNKYTSAISVQHTASPNSRYKVERYREATQKTKQITECISNQNSRYYYNAPSSQISQLVPSETYTYLSSTVHTPVKRYVPTPPSITNNMYADLNANASSSVSNTTNHSGINTLPFNYRKKCCHNDLHNTNSNGGAASSILLPIYNNKPLQQNTAQPPSKIVQDKCSSPITSAITNNSSVIMMMPSLAAVCNRQGVGLPTSHQQQLNMISIGDFGTGLNTNNSSISHTSITANNFVSNTDSEAEPGTCLHCNTARRTGVHQTTQTTGPVSPVPVTTTSSIHDQHINSNFTTSAVEFHRSSASPSISHQTKINDNTDIYTPQQQIYMAPQTKNTTSVITSATSSRNQQHSINSNQAQQQSQQQIQPLQIQQQLQRRYSHKKRLNEFFRKKIAQFFGVELSTEAEDYILWRGRQRRFAIRRFGALNSEPAGNKNHNDVHNFNANSIHQNHEFQQSHHSERPDILPAQDMQEMDLKENYFYNSDFQTGEYVERKASVFNMFLSCFIFIANALYRGQSTLQHRNRQWSRSFAPVHVFTSTDGENYEVIVGSDISESYATIIEEEVFFDSSGDTTSAATPLSNTFGNVGVGLVENDTSNDMQQQHNKHSMGSTPGVSHGIGVGVYIADRHHGWRTTALNTEQNTKSNITTQQVLRSNIHSGNISQSNQSSTAVRLTYGVRGNRILAQLLDGVLENSRRPQQRHIKYFSINDLDDRTDHRPYFTYWINTVHIMVLFLSIFCYGLAPIGFGVEHKTGQVLVTSLSLQTVQHIEQRNFWIGPRNNDLVHIGAKFAACMRRDVKIIEVLGKTRRQERETACCIRNDDSGCVQSSQADCSVRGLYPTKSISTWKKWSPGESGPGGRISGSVCGLDPKYCDAPASIAPYEWPDDITKWPICKKTNSFSQRFRYKDHTAEHMVCEVIGHPCCTGIYGECRITTREYCDFVSGYFHEEASLCSQISCLNNVCGMFPFFSIENPDQFYRLLTSLCLHAGILHLVITVVFQHVVLTDLERLLGPIRTAVVYIGSGLAGNMASAVLVPYKTEVGPTASLCGVTASMFALLISLHWKKLQKPHIALFKLIAISALLFGIGTLPFQLNFAGLLTGLLCGIILTAALVPFITISKYGRKSKINLIWTSFTLYGIMYASMLIVFYMFPMELTNLSFNEDISNSFNTVIKQNDNDLNNANIISSSSVSMFAGNGRLSHNQNIKHILSNDGTSDDTDSTKVKIMQRVYLAKNDSIDHKQQKKQIIDQNNHYVRSIAQSFSLGNNISNGNYDIHMQNYHLTGNTINNDVSYYKAFTTTYYESITKSNHNKSYLNNSKFLINPFVLTNRSSASSSHYITIYKNNFNTTDSEKDI